VQKQSSGTLRWPRSTPTLRSSAAFYNLFALCGPHKDAAFWNSAAATSPAFFGRATNAQTGQASRYSKFDGSPHRYRSTSLSAKVACDAWRVGGMMDWSWTMQPGSDEQARADALVTFFHSQGVSEYLAPWNVNGTGGNGHHSPGLIAMNAVATPATTEAVADKSRDMVLELWNIQLSRGKYRYYDGRHCTFASLLFKWPVQDPHPGFGDGRGSERCRTGRPSHKSAVLAQSHHSKNRSVEAGMLEAYGKLIYKRRAEALPSSPSHLSRSRHV
jgi:hypothetical protein